VGLGVRVRFRVIGVCCYAIFGVLHLLVGLMVTLWGWCVLCYMVKGVRSYLVIMILGWWFGFVGSDVCCCVCLVVLCLSWISLL